jgi:hypothetical protein
LHWRSIRTIDAPEDFVHNHYEMDSFWKSNLAWSLHDAWQLYSGAKIVLLLLAFCITAVLHHRRQKPGASKTVVQDAAWGLVATFVAVILIFASHLFVFTPEHIYESQRSTIRALETNILELQAGKHVDRSSGKESANEKTIHSP